MLSYILSSDYYKSKYQSTLKTVEAVLSCSIKYPSSVYVKIFAIMPSEYCGHRPLSRLLAWPGFLEPKPGLQALWGRCLCSLSISPAPDQTAVVFLRAYFFLFLSCFWKVAGMLQGWRADSENWEMSGVVLHDVKYPPIKKLYFLNVIWFSFLYHGIDVISNHYFSHIIYLSLFLYEHFIPCFKMFCFIFVFLSHLELSFV